MEITKEFVDAAIAAHACERAIAWLKRKPRSWDDLSSRPGWLLWAVKFVPGAADQISEAALVAAAGVVPWKALVYAAKLLPRAALVKAALAEPKFALEFAAETLPLWLWCRLEKQHER